MDKQEKVAALPDGMEFVEYQVLQRGEWSTAAGPLIEESFVTIYVNGRELVTMMATPQQQENLAVGYLFTEGFISGRGDIQEVSLAPNQVCVDVLLGKELVLPKKRVLTSGCGKGVTFANHPETNIEKDAGPNDDHPPLTTRVGVSQRQLADLMAELQKESQLYQKAGGVHGAGLAAPKNLLMMAEDVGRHNTLDKIAGRCVLEGIDPAGRILLTTGRISSEMLNKAYQLQVPIVASLTSPTSLSIRRAELWNITVVGYLRPQSMRVYTHPQRIVPD